MVTGYNSSNEVIQRVKQLEQFMTVISVRVSPCFEYNTTWKNSDFTEWQSAELNRFYTGIKAIDVYLKQQNYQSAFCELAYVLESLRRMPSKFAELENFALIGFSYDHNMNLTIDLSEFEHKEPNFKFAREFQEIRYGNYKKYYSGNV